jgi:hypothetical protein
MGTELNPTGRNISVAAESDGRPLGNYLYKQSLDQKFRYGKRIMTFDGRVFKYGNSRTALKAGYGAGNYCDVATQNGAVLPAAIAAGDMRLQITIANTNGYAGGAIAQDELVGGYVEIQETGKSATTRCIVGNDYVSTAGGTIYVYVDGAIEEAYTTSGWCDMILNPYAYLGNGNLNFNAFMGVPNFNTTILYNAFIQTWGPCYVVGGGGHAFGATANDRTMYFVGDGSVNAGLYLTVESGYQLAGFIIDSTATVAGASATSGVPLLMLQISI